MENDFLVEMGYTGLTGRLKRLNDLFVNQTRHFYKEKNIDIEPNWHMIFLLLQKHQQLTVTEISERLYFSHPAIVKLINKMKENGYVKSNRDESDSRKYQLTLTEKAILKLPELECYWNAGEKALEDLLENNDTLLSQLSVLERNIMEKNFKTRMVDILE